MKSPVNNENDTDNEMVTGAIANESSVIESFLQQSSLRSEPISFENFGTFCFEGFLPRYSNLQNVNKNNRGLQDSVRFASQSHLRPIRGVVTSTSIEDIKNIIPPHSVELEDGELEASDNEDDYVNVSDPPHFLEYDCDTIEALCSIFKNKASRYSLLGEIDVPASRCCAVAAWMNEGTSKSPTCEPSATPISTSTGSGTSNKFFENDKDRFGVFASCMKFFNKVEYGAASVSDESIQMEDAKKELRTVDDIGVMPTAVLIDEDDPETVSPEEYDEWMQEFGDRPLEIRDDDIPMLESDFESDAGSDGDEEETEASEIEEDDEGVAELSAASPSSRSTTIILSDESRPPSSNSCRSVAGFCCATTPHLYSPRPKRRCLENELRSALEEDNNSEVDSSSENHVFQSRSSANAASASKQQHQNTLRLFLQKSVSTKKNLKSAHTYSATRLIKKYSNLRSSSTIASRLSAVKKHKSALLSRSSKVLAETKSMKQKETINGTRNAAQHSVFCESISTRNSYSRGQDREKSSKSNSSTSVQSTTSHVSTDISVILLNMDNLHNEVRPDARQNPPSPANQPVSFGSLCEAPRLDVEPELDSLNNPYDSVFDNEFQESEVMPPLMPTAKTGFVTDDNPYMSSFKATTSEERHATKTDESQLLDDPYHEVSASPEALFNGPTNTTSPMVVGPGRHFSPEDDPYALIEDEDDDVLIEVDDHKNDEDDLGDDDDVQFVQMIHPEVSSRKGTSETDPDSSPAKQILLLDLNIKHEKITERLISHHEEKAERMRLKRQKAREQMAQKRRQTIAAIASYYFQRKSLVPSKIYKPVPELTIEIQLKFNEEPRLSPVEIELCEKRVIQEFSYNHPKIIYPFNKADGVYWPFFQPIDCIEGNVLEIPDEKIAEMEMVASLKNHSFSGYCQKAQFLVDPDPNRWQSSFDEAQKIMKRCEKNKEGQSFAETLKKNGRFKNRISFQRKFNEETEESQRITAQRNIEDERRRLFARSASEEEAEPCSERESNPAVIADPDFDAEAAEEDDEETRDFKSRRLADHLRQATIDTYSLEMYSDSRLKCLRKRNPDTHWWMNEGRLRMSGYESAYQRTDMLCKLMNHLNMISDVYTMTEIADFNITQEPMEWVKPAIYAAFLLQGQTKFVACRKPDGPDGYPGGNLLEPYTDMLISTPNENSIADSRRSRIEKYENEVKTGTPLKLGVLAELSELKQWEEPFWPYIWDSLSSFFQRFPPISQLVNDPDIRKAVDDAFIHVARLDVEQLRRSH